MNSSEPMNYFPGEFPRRIEIELASACNLKCAYCPRRFVTGLNGFMDTTLFKRLVDEISLYPETILVLHRRGESFLHPDFPEICGYVKGKFKEIQIATNATLLDNGILKTLIDSLTFISFSIDSPESFDRNRAPARYVSVEKNILSFLELNKGKIKTQVSMVRTPKTSEQDLMTFRRIWSGKVDRIRIYEEHSHDGNFGSLGRNRGERKTCAMPFYEMLICYDGKVGRCNHDWDGAPIGDINSSFIKELWNSPVYNELRAQHLTLKIKDRACKSCDCWYPQAGRQETGEVIE